MFNLARKNHLAMNLNKLRKEYPDHYSFYPKTWILPADKGDLISQFKDRKPKTFILKPQASCQGRGIMLIQYAEQIPDGEPMVAQKYVLKPYLLDGLKFDLRIYFLVASSDPLRLYIFKEGMARLATNQYSAPSKSNLQNMFVHLTNYAINKANDEFEQNDGIDPGTGHKRLMSWVFDNMRANGVDTNTMWKQIKRLALKTLCAAQPQIAHHYRSGQSEDYHSHMCFEILGFDVMIDSQARPILIEVNHTPSFSTDSKLDHTLKSNVIHDAIRLMNMTQKMKNKLIKQKKKESELRVVTGKRVKLTLEQRDEMKQQCMQKRDKYIKKNLGGYEQIYPIPEGEENDEPYEEFMKFANREFEIQTGAVKKQIKKEEPLSKPAFGSRIPVSQIPKKPSVQIVKKSLQNSTDFSKTESLRNETGKIIPSKPIKSISSLIATNTNSQIQNVNLRPSSTSKDILSSHKESFTQEDPISNQNRMNNRTLIDRMGTVALDHSLNPRSNETPNHNNKIGLQRIENGTADPRYESMKQEIMNRVEYQQELKRQQAIRVQVQRGLVPVQESLQKGGQVPRINKPEAFSDIKYEQPNSLHNFRESNRPSSNERYSKVTPSHFHVNGIQSTDKVSGQQRYFESQIQTYQSLPEASTGILRAKKQANERLPFYIPEQKLLPFEQSSNRIALPARQIPKRFPVINNKVELVLKPTVFSFGPGLSVKGYQVPGKL